VKEKNENENFGDMHLVFWKVKKTFCPPVITKPV
jgi:hypothetical protein